MEQNDISKLSFNDRIWDNVRLCMEVKHNQRNSWKYIINDDNNVNNLCEVCNDGGLLLKCRKTDCKKWCHVLCAHERGFGLYIQENGVMELECDFHFGDVIFCTCKSKYDKTKAMVSCDNCREWFHCSCISMKESSKLSKLKDKDYMCVSCTNLKKQGNIAKEDRSGAQLEAEAVMNELSQLIDYVGDVVDTVRDIPLRGGVYVDHTEPNSNNAMQSDSMSISITSSNSSSNSSATSGSGVTRSMVDDIELQDIEVALTKLGGPVYTKCIENVRIATTTSSNSNTIVTTTKPSKSTKKRKSLTLGDTYLTETDDPIYASICTIDDLLYEYKNYLCSYQSEVGKWTQIWDKAMKKFIKCCAGTLRDVKGSVPSTLPTATQLSQGQGQGQISHVGIDKMGYLFDIELYKDLCVLNELLQELVGIECLDSTSSINRRSDSSHSSNSSHSSGPGSPTGTRVHGSEYRDILATVTLHLKPTNFDICTLISKYLSWLVYAFQIVNDNMMYVASRSSNNSSDGSGMMMDVDTESDSNTGGGVIGSGNSSDTAIVIDMDMDTSSGSNSNANVNSSPRISRVSRSINGIAVMLTRIPVYLYMCRYTYIHISL